MLRHWNGLAAQLQLSRIEGLNHQGILTYEKQVSADVGCAEYALQDARARLCGRLGVNRGDIDSAHFGRPVPEIEEMLSIRKEDGNVVGRFPTRPVYLGKVDGDPAGGGNTADGTHGSVG